MAEFGIQTLRPNGSVAMDGSNKAGIFIEALDLTLTRDEVGSKVYPNVPAGSLYIMIPSASSGYHEISTGDDGAGHATLTWTRNTFSTSYGADISTYKRYVVFVFAKRINQTQTFGVATLNSAGDQLTDYTYPVPQYSETLQASATAVEKRFATDRDPGYVTRIHKVTATLRPNTSRLVALYLPDSTTNNVWYSCTELVHKAGFVPNADGGGVVYDGTGEIEIMAIIPETLTNYQVPSVHVFSMDGPISGGGSFGVQYLNPQGNLVYDSSAENITISDQQPLRYQGLGYPAQSMTLNMPAKCGVVIPFIRVGIQRDIPTDINGNTYYWERWAGAVQRRGNTLYYKMFNYADNEYGNQTIVFNSQNGTSAGNNILVIDVEQLTPTTVTARQ